ncbi:MAG: cell wall-active antibiotics response protein [Acidobacteriota bacterium]|nr:cell wall-active antibiotics response protein [Acidobacteriota bacterium]
MSFENARNSVDSYADQKFGKKPRRPNIVFGLILVVVGVLFLLRNLEVYYFDEFWNFWPVLLIALGLSKAFSGRADERTFGWIMTFIGGVFFARHVLHVDVHLGDWWPVIPVIVGVSIMIRAIRGPQAPGEAPELSSVLSERAIIGGIARKNTSQSFQGGELTAIMGGCEIDLRDARMAGPQAVIDCFAMWGGIEIQIPPDWVVDPQVSVLAAGFEDRSKPPVQPAGRLVVRGTALMAGIEIKN